MSVRTRLLGIDFGTVRIGLAVTDSERMIASPLATYERLDEPRDAVYFRQLVEREEIAQIVVGLPIHNDGRVGDKAQEALRFGQWLTSITLVPVVYHDERFSTVLAEGHLRGAKMTRDKRKERRDRVAAQIILQSYLEAGCPASYEGSKSL